jgi:uncharacterized tellurite resistance protein B-like protein
MPVESVCRFCGRRERAGSVVTPGRALDTAEQALAAITEWAAREGAADVGEFARRNLAGVSPEEAAARLAAHQPLPTSFDAVAWLFADTGGAAREAQGSAGSESAMAAGRALISVMLADGEIRPGERQFIDQFLVRAGLPPASSADLHDWGPGDLQRPADPAAVLFAMVTLMHLDRKRDDREWRVIQRFAEAWGYPVERLVRLDRSLDEAYAPLMRRLWLTLRGLVG